MLFEDKLKPIKPFNYELSDGNQFIIEEQKIRWIELFFKSSIIKKRGNGLPKASYYLIQKANFDFKIDLYNNICLRRGNTILKDL